ncbi:hypothetical protein JCM5296_000259 [Sporobolomyces johnsonii]
MAFNGMPQIPSVSQTTLAITATQYSSFATPAITVPFPSAYAQTQIPFTFSDTATWAATRIPTTIGGVAATAGVHSINSEASSAGYRDHQGGSGGGGGGWPTWATAVIASCGGAALVIIVIGLYCWRLRRKQRARAGGAGAARGRSGKKKKGGVITEKHVGGGAARRSRGYQQDQDAVFAAVPRGADGGGEKRSRNGSPSKMRKTARPQTLLAETDSTPSSGSGSSYPPYPTPPGTSSDVPSRSRSPNPRSSQQNAHLAALGINRPQSVSPSPYRSRPPSSQAPSEGSAYPAFAVPRAMRERDPSTSSEHDLLPPPPVAALPPAPQYSRSGYETPPPRPAHPGGFIPNNDSPAAGSPARLLAPAGEYEESPQRSSVHTTSTQEAAYPYRWDQDQQLQDEMPDPDEVGRKLGEAMMGRERVQGYRDEDDGYLDYPAPRSTMPHHAPDDFAARRYREEDDHERSAAMYGRPDSSMTARRTSTLRPEQLSRASTYQTVEEAGSSIDEEADERARGYGYAD